MRGPARAFSSDSIEPFLASLGTESSYKSDILQKIPEKHHFTQRDPADGRVARPSLPPCLSTTSTYPLGLMTTMWI